MIRKMPDEPCTSYTLDDQEYLQILIDFITDNPDQFRLPGEEHKNDFTRKRKLPLETLVKILIDQNGTTAYSSLMKSFHQISPDQIAPTEEAFRKRRKNLNPDGLKSMLIHSTAAMYDNHPEMWSHYKGYLVVAIDGSDVWVPRNDQTEEVFGCTSSNPGEDDPCMAKLSGAYSSADQLYLDVEIESYKYSERELAARHIMTIHDQYPDLKILFVLDRGYYSIELMELIDSLGYKFMFRLPKTTLKKHTEQVLPGEQKNIEIRFSTVETNQIRDNKALRSRVLSKTYHLSVSKPFKDKDMMQDEDEDNLDHMILLSNIPASDGTVTDEPTLNITESDHLYRHFRWTIETAFDRLKNVFGLEDFTAEDPQLIKQEIYSTVIAYNTTSLAIKSAFDEYPIDQLHYKHIMQPNFQKAAVNVKLDLLKAVTEPDPVKRQEYFEKMHWEIGRHIQAIRPCRKYRRKKKIKMKGRNKRKKG